MRWWRADRQEAGGGLGQLERIIVPMRERLGHTTIGPVQFAFIKGDCDPAVCGVLVIAGIVCEIMARWGVWPPRPLPGLSVSVELRHEFAALLTQAIEPEPHARSKT